MLNEEFEDLGSVHFGRKAVQPSPREIQGFYHSADERLKSPKLSFTEFQIDAIGREFGKTVAVRGDTCYACAILPDHAHLVIRAHRDSAETMTSEFQRTSRLMLYEIQEVSFDHPVWTENGWKVFLFSPDEIRARIRYVENNPVKAGLPPQSWPFVQTYDGWPYRPT